ncbi:MAG TPA: hypothetical protein VN753_07095 [Terracidiphilus sp.]|nr:hypothetical protein [Terracidiphilus sp.]
MTLHGTDLIAIAGLVAAGSALGYAFLWWRVRALITERQLKTADQIGALDDAIRAMETRLAEHQLASSIELQQAPDVPLATESDSATDENGVIAPEMQAAIAAAAVAALGRNAVVQSVRAVTSPWTQQGRVLVQGGHNLRVRR